MKIRFAFAGFRHGHIFDLFAGIKAHPDCQIVAQCEQDPATREALKSRDDVTITHNDFRAMLRDTDFDVLAIGDYYANRGTLAIAALEAGKHVIADKPLCTALDECDRIESLASAKGLALGCQFDLRGDGTIRTLRKLILAGEIGDVHTVSFSGQHPLLLGSRPAWYFQPGCHGGTINDIAIHAVDAIPWLTGRSFVEVTAARAWNARTGQFPHFQDAAQMMFRLDNDGGVLGDVSYLAPDGCGYSVPQYWRFVIHGDKGVLETTLGNKDIFLAANTDKAPRSIPAEETVQRAYLPDFLTLVRDKNASVPLSTATILRTTRTALLAQAAADQKRTNVPCK